MQKPQQKEEFNENGQKLSGLSWRVHSDISFEHSHKPFDFKGKLGGNTENWPLAIQSGLNSKQQKTQKNLPNSWSQIYYSDF